MPIRVLLVEDSPVAVAVLTKILQQSPQIEIVGVAHNGIEALKLIPKTQPQVICTDMYMPHMGGLALISEIMARFPLPILVISIAVQAEEDTQHVFQLLEAGAVDVFPKPIGGLSADSAAVNQALIDKIRILAGVRVFRKKRPAAIAHPGLPVSPLAARPLTDSQTLAQPQKKPKIVVVGASTGGPKALQLLLGQLPSSFLPVICVQHIGSGFLQGLIDWLKQDCALSVEIAQPGQPPTPGHIYFPPEHHHLTLDRRGLFAYSDAPPIDGHRPSISVTFEAIAHHYRQRAVGVLLTGMGQDGAVGLQAIAQAGGWTISQDEATSAVFGMPKAAIELGAACRILPIEAIAPALIQFVNQPVLPSLTQS